MRSRRRALIGMFGLLAITASACGPPPPGPDRTPPSVDAATPAAFVVGSQISTDPPPEPGWPTGFSTGIQARMSWSATDARSGICSYDLEREFAGSAPAPILSGTLATEHVEAETDYDDQFGGGSLKVVGWTVIARDCAGNSSRVFVAGQPLVLQEDGANVQLANGLGPTYTGTWGTSSCTCWSNGSVRRTTEPGATMTFENTLGAGRIALVMEQAPDRGQFRVVVDGVERAVVDNGLVSAPRHRVVVWEGQIEPDSVLEVVNLATPDRPRIDVDAIIVR